MSLSSWEKHYREWNVHSTNDKIKSNEKFLLENDSSYNGGSRPVSDKDRTCSGQIKALIEKLSNLKYYVLIQCLEQIIEISRYTWCWYKNEWSWKY